MAGVMVMREQLDRLVEQFNEGLRRLNVLDQERSQLRDQMLRLSGAIQVLREICDGQQHATDAAAHAPTEAPSTNVTADAA